MVKKDWFDWFCDKVRRASFVRAAYRVNIIKASEHDNRRMSAAGQATQRSACSEAVHAGHHDVKENDVRRELRKQGERFRPAQGLGDDKLCLVKGLGQLLQHSGA